MRVSVKSCGIGLRVPHVQELLQHTAPVGFVEAHAENYFGGGLPRQQILQIAERYPLSLHGVGLALGRADDLDIFHLARFAALVQQTQPILVSEHLSWSAYQHIHVPDLLPLPFTHEALDIMVAHVQQFQDTIGRAILIENPSNYLAFAQLDYTEPEFLNALCQRSGCGLLLDINNIVVSAHNLQQSPHDYLHAIAAQHVQQLHLAGYQINQDHHGEPIYIDTHGQNIQADVWALYDIARQQYADIPVLVEWDTEIPPLAVLVAEAEKVNARHR
jgi:hypothetical protein